MKISILVLCLFAHAGFSQINRIDSLKQILLTLEKRPEGYISDTLRCNTLKTIMKAYANVNVDSSTHYNTLMINLCTDKNLQRELIYAYQYAGYLYQVKGDYHQCIRFHYKALPLAEKLKQYARVARSYGALAHAYTSLKEFTKGVKLCQLGLAVLKSHPDATIRLSIINVLGAIYRQQGKLDEALKVNKELYEGARIAKNPWYEAQGLHAVGWVYKEMGEMDLALAYYQRALPLAYATGSVDLEGSILLNTANVYIQKKEWEKALTYCYLARGAAVKVKNSSLVAEAEERLYTIFKQTGEPAKALKAYENFVLLKDSLSKEKTAHRIETLQAQYDNIQKTNDLDKEKAKLATEKKTRNVLFFGIVAILIVSGLLYWNNRRLQAKNHEINRQRTLLENARLALADINKTLEMRVDQRTQELVNANRELVLKNEEIKEALFQGQTIERKRVALELHDNLSSLLSAVNMSIQSINPQYLSESQQSVYHNLKHLIQNAYAEVRNISHNILPAELEREGLASTLTTLVGQLNQNSPLQFSLSIIGLYERLPVKIEFNVYSIIWELINNAIKHAQATGVVIALLRTDYGISLMVSDNGVGLGSRNDKRGIGIQNILSRLESLGGTFDNNPQAAGKGTQVQIKIPIESVRINGDVFTV